MLNLVIESPAGSSIDFMSTDRRATSIFTYLLVHVQHSIRIPIKYEQE